MKSTIKFFQICLLLCGVFGVYADEVKTVPVMEGESVTLNTDLTEIKEINMILWRFGDEGSTIAQIDEGVISYSYLTKLFGARLQLDNQTGSLTIKNMRTNHTGPYKLEITHNSGTSTTPFTFSVTVYESPSVIDAGKAETKSASVMEGDPVTLQTDVTLPHGDELIVWRFGDEGKLIAKCDIEAKSSPIYDTDERFRDRLKLDEKTGSLTITNSRITDSRVYTVKIFSSKQTLYKKFSVIISAVPDPGLSPGAKAGIVVAVLLAVVLAAVAAAVIYIRYRMSELEKQIDLIKPEPVYCVEGDCAVLRSYHEIKKGVQMLWRLVSVKDSAIASVSENDKKTYWYDVRFRGRLQLDPQTGSLIIRNLQKTDAGVYFLEIKSEGGTAYRKYEVILFGEVETSEVETVSVKEGDDVTLEFSVKSDFQTKWEFEVGNGVARIASLIINNSKENEPKYPDGSAGGRFRDRLELNTQTGFLTIKNIRPEHTGLYIVLIGECVYMKFFNVVFDDFTETSGNESVITGFMGRIQRFCGLARIGGVFGDEKDEMKTLSVMEGDVLKLNTETEIQTDDEIILRFGTARERRPYVTIARFSKPGDEFKSEERRFNDRLKLDLTGRLTITITNFEITDCGDYYVQITNKKKKSFKSFTFIVVPSGDVVKSVSVMNGKPIYLENKLTNLQKEDQMLWTFGPHGIIIANTNTSRCDTRFRGRLTLDEETGSLIITNSTTADSGMYHLQIISSYRVINQRFNVTVNVRNISVTEGKSVTLNPETEIQKDDQIQWMFGDQDIFIAEIRGGTGETHDDADNGRFRDRLKLDEKTGSLTIPDTKTTDSGDYKLQIGSNSGVSYKTFRVTVTEKTLTKYEGDPVTLETDTEIHRNYIIKWRFGNNGPPIAEIKGGIISINDDVADERFRGRLELDKTTGSLTITDTELKHAGVYHLEITSISGVSYKTFRVVVRERNISVTEGKNVILNPETEIQKDDLIQWRFGDQHILIAEIRGGTGETHDDDERFRGRLKLYEKTGSLIITDSTADQSGVYKLQIISSSRGTTNKTFVVTVYTSLKPVREGESLTLKPETEIQKDDQIQWRFGDQHILIAEIRGGTGETRDDNGRFRGRLTLDEKTGSLTITRMRKEHNGDYKLQISSSRGNTNKTFKVFVDCWCTLKRVKEGDDVTLSSDTYIVKDEVKWFFNDGILAKGIDGDIIKTSYCDDEIFKDRLELDHQTGSLTIKNTRTSDSGVYCLKFLTLGIERIFAVAVNEDLFLDIKPPPSKLRKKGNKVNEATVEMPPVNEEDLDAGNEQEGMSLLVMR